jgi:filamentous hemagglutinin family protein
LAVFADIRTDSSLGKPAQTLCGPNYLIPQSLGKLAGSNLFHSFESFNINTGQSATFITATPGITNVISRVTGGNLSQINGPLKLTAASGAPNFYFINPAGIAFGGGASIDVPGAFHVSTADYVKFPDGNFHADTTKTSTFSTAKPEAFGFLGTTRATISVNAKAELVTKRLRSISVVAGDIDLNGGVVLAQNGGDVRGAAVGKQASEIVFSGEIPAAEGDFRVANGAILATQSSSLNIAGSVLIGAGQLSVVNGSFIQSMGLDASGRSVNISARNITLDGKGSYGAIIADTDNSSSGGIAVKATDSLAILNGGRISAVSYGSGQGGSIQIAAGNIEINAMGNSYTGVSSSAQSTGNAGGVDIFASGKVSILNGASISSGAYSSGSGGSVKVVAGNIMIARQGSSLTGIFSDANSGSGGAGVIEVQALDNLSIFDGGTISSRTLSKGAAGTVSVGAGTIVIDNQGGKYATGIFSDANRGSMGNAGGINVRSSGDISILNGGAISSSTFAVGSAGFVRVNARNFLIGNSLPNIDDLGGIAASAWEGSQGNAGNVNVQATENISLISGGVILSSTNSTGKGGSVLVHAGNLLVDGMRTSINASASIDSSGQTGTVSVSAKESITLSNGGQIAITNNATVAKPESLSPTHLTVSAPNIGLKDAQITAASTGNVAASNIQINFGDRLNLDPSSITTSAKAGNGGSIRIQGPGVVVLDNSQITTSVAGLTGNGGDININAEALVMNTGFIQANTAAKNATGGNVGIDVQLLVPNGATLFVGGQTPHTFQQGVFGYNVIQAAAPTGVSGAINIASPVLDLSGTLTGLSVRMTDTGGFGRSPCRIAGGSSLIQVGRGGFAPSARGLLAPALLPQGNVGATTSLPNNIRIGFAQGECAQG